MKRSRISLSVAMALMLAACGNGPDDTANEFVTAVYSGRSEDALELIDPGAVKEVRPKLTAIIDGAGKNTAAKGGLKAVKTLDTKLDGDIATVRLEKTFGDASSSTETIKVHKVAGTWYVMIG